MINYTEKEILEILKDEQKTDEFLATLTGEDVKKLLSDNLGLWTKEELKESYEKDLRHRYDKAFSNGEQEMVKSLYAEDEPLANTAVQILNRIARISWGSGGHSAGYVPLFVLCRSRKL